MRALIFTVVLAFVWSAAYADESIVFSGYPGSKVESNETSTARYDLTRDEGMEYRVLITKRGDKYYWASRENKELRYFRSGIAHWFISDSSGYVKIIDPSLIPGMENEQGFWYLEHLTLLTNTITYWGYGESLTR